MDDTISNFKIRWIRVESVLAEKSVSSAQFGEIFELDCATSESDGVFGSTPRSWFTLGHASFVCSTLLLRTHLA